VTIQNGQPQIPGSDPILGRELTIKSDVLVLSTGAACVEDLEASVPNFPDLDPSSLTD